MNRNLYIKNLKSIKSQLDKMILMEGKTEVDNAVKKLIKLTGELFERGIFGSYETINLKTVDEIYDVFIKIEDEIDFENTAKEFFDHVDKGDSKIKDVLQDLQKQVNDRVKRLQSNRQYNKDVFKSNAISYGATCLLILPQVLPGAVGLFKHIFSNLDNFNFKKFVLLLNAASISMYAFACLFAFGLNVYAYLYINQNSQIGKLNEIQVFASLTIRVSIFVSIITKILVGLLSDPSEGI